ncbi:MAG TPA: hypothetical protein VMU08_06460 [Rhizomicrobium sp.]|nr:hypothetical protein [Rhizomicrobium sp.]
MSKQLAAVAAALALATLAFAAEVPLKGFSHDNKDDLFGYYFPSPEIRVGKFRLDQFGIGTLDELKTYESGRGRLPTYAPVMFTFEDTTSKQLTNELGGTYHANEPRVLPTAYRIRGNTIAFAGSDRQIGVVTFSGTIDRAALKAAQATGMESDKPVIRGDLTIAGKTFKGVGFRWFGGD